MVVCVSNGCAYAKGGGGCSGYRKGWKKEDVPSLELVWRKKFSLMIPGALLALERTTLQTHHANLKAGKDLSNGELLHINIAATLTRSNGEGFNNAKRLRPPYHRPSTTRERDGRVFAPCIVATPWR
ncbi:hypothetical protein CDAR_196151 [Caerostris darwini]|uniref:Uncharacterized protein n=1 Tax=Caerostris darwini TaxID=1538125 RepID=A0AAV4MI20_9ARAC|nr:hypothetical protein CDAR_196151 [Caerostris darwini]